MFRYLHVCHHEATKLRDLTGSAFMKNAPYNTNELYPYSGYLEFPERHTFAALLAVTNSFHKSIPWRIEKWSYRLIRTEQQHYSYL